MDQTRNSPISSQIVDNNNESQISNNNINMSNTNLDTSYINTATPPSQNTSNITYEFYLPLPNDTRIFYVTYTELDSLEVARLLNNRINISSHNSNIHSLIQQLICQDQQHQQHNVQQQTFDNTTSQIYLNNEAYNAASAPSTGITTINNHDMQVTGYNDVQFMQTRLNPNNNI
ncbi:hypothetical protein C1645_781829 [Glomus cerebriforme]|uniref:Uncharacterized protein n=1 Tax=Glomus cerebriforme TaxID=658196 RepID=A0A397SNB4_9GLOM|nr:hypothetical protein C1645_781829 [Glomus cerebriforme]